MLINIHVHYEGKLIFNRSIQSVFFLLSFSFFILCSFLSFCVLKSEKIYFVKLCTGWPAPGKSWKNLEKPGICNRYLENLENREENPKTWKNLECLKLFLEKLMNLPGKRQFMKCFFSFILATF